MQGLKNMDRESDSSQFLVNNKIRRSHSCSFPSSTITRSSRHHLQVILCIVAWQVAVQRCGTVTEDSSLPPTKTRSHVWKTHSASSRFLIPKRRLDLCTLIAPTPSLHSFSPAPHIRLSFLATSLPPPRSRGSRRLAPLTWT